MRAVVYHDVGTVAVDDVAAPVIEDAHDAVVRVTLTAVCGSDLHAYHGSFPMKPGETMGHEAVGVVEEVGPEVSRFSPGDRVVVAFCSVDGTCWYCRRGQTSLCERFRNLGFGEFGGGLGGLQCEFGRVPFADMNLLHVPDGMEDERALFVGDVLTTGWYGASISGAAPGAAIAVVGAGPVGFFVAQASLALGADQVMVLDRVQERLELAARTGVVAIDVERDDPRAAIRELTEGRGADAAVEAVGNLAAFRTAVSIVRRGGRIGVVGVFGQEELDLDIGYFWSRGLTVSFAGICPVHAWWAAAMEAVRSGEIDPLPLISHSLGLEDAPKAYELFDRREATKVVLRP
jgi:alcohol dehydrogenase